MDESEKMMRDSDMVFTAVSTGCFENFEQAQRAVVLFYVPDTSVSPWGISHALKRLEEFYKKKRV